MSPHVYLAPRVVPPFLSICTIHGHVDLTFLLGNSPIKNLLYSCNNFTIAFKCSLGFKKGFRPFHLYALLDLKFLGIWTLLGLDLIS